VAPSEVAPPERTASHHKVSSISKEKIAKTTPPASRVHVTISTEPAGADVCLVSDRVLLGKTSFDWAVERSPQTYKLLIRKTGYRGQELTVSADGDVRHRVALDKLGPDDIDDVVNCKPR
jgi:hypothetical protein